MIKPPFNLFDEKTPRIFSDGTSTYNEFAEAYITHDKGLFILAPSGAGKTHYVKQQTEQHWIDGDDLWMATNAHPGDEWWLMGVEKIMEVDARCDVITQQAKQLGFWVVGASNNWLKPDAIVLPEWEQHKKWIQHRETTNYDGGATSDRLEQVLSHRKVIEAWESHGVPKFETVQDAVEALTK